MFSIINTKVRFDSQSTFPRYIQLFENRKRRTLETIVCGFDPIVEQHHFLRSLTLISLFNFETKWSTLLISSYNLSLQSTALSLKTYLSRMDILK